MRRWITRDTESNADGRRSAVSLMAANGVTPFSAIAAACLIAVAQISLFAIHVASSSKKYLERENV